LSVRGVKLENEYCVFRKKRKDGKFLNRAKGEKEKGSPTKRSLNPSKLDARGN